MMRRYHDKPLWQRVELAVVWSVSLCGCAMFWWLLIGKIGEML